MKKLAAMSICLALLCGCTDEADWTTHDVSGSDDASWTILLYLCGSDLETDYNCASYNLEELMNASFGEHINMVVETGGADTWHTDGVSSQQQARYVIRDGEMIRAWAESPQNMGDPDTLQNFITWGKEKFPADKYALILWDHGGGSLYGICADENFDDDTLSLSELSEALDGGNTDFDLIGLDACLMASLETAEAVMNHGQYLAASQETEPGYGWDYRAMIEYLDENPTADGSELGKKIVDSYYEKCEQFETAETATLSLIDLKKIPAVSEAFQLYTTDLLSSSQDAEALSSLQQSADNTETYGVTRENDDEGFNMVDLSGLMDNTAGIVGNNALNVKNASGNAVIYEKHGSARTGANGMSVFYPLMVDDDVLHAYADISTNAAYIEYASVLGGNEFDIDSWHQARSEWMTELEDDSSESSGILDQILQSLDALSDLEPVTADDADIQYHQYLDDDYILHMDITEGLEYVRNVWFDIYYEDEENGRYFYLGSDNNLNSDYSSGEFYDNFNGEWLSIGDEYVNAQIIDENDDYSLYTIPITLNGKDTNLRARYDYEEGEYSVLGTYDGSSSSDGMAARDNLKKLQNGDKIDFVFTAYSFDSDDEGKDYILGSIVWSDDIVMCDAPLGDGKYIYRFEIYDIFGNEISCDPYIMETEGSNMYVQPF